MKNHVAGEVLGWRHYHGQTRAETQRVTAGAIEDWEEGKCKNYNR